MKLLYSYLKHKCLFEKWKTGKKNRSCLGVSSTGGGKKIWKRYGENMRTVKNEKMRLVETIPGMGEGR
jgi:hypothetical protein